MAEIFAEKERKKRTPSLLPTIKRSQAVHMPLAVMAIAARNMRIPAEQTQIGPGAVAATDFNMRVADNVAKLRTTHAEVSSRLGAMLERLSG